jgi:outer membrane protein assembly factor BamB
MIFVTQLVYLHRDNGLHPRGNSRPMSTGSRCLVWWAPLLLLAACSDGMTPGSESSESGEATTDAASDTSGESNDGSMADLAGEGGLPPDALDSVGDRTVGDAANLDAAVDATSSDAKDSPEARSPGDASPTDASDGDALVADVAAGDVASDAPVLPPDRVDGGPPPPDPTSASSFLINPAHTNAVVGSTLQPPLTRVWSASLPGSPSYPLIVSGRVYAVASSFTSNPAATMVALDAQTGSPIWSTPLPGATTAGLAYDGGRVFTADGSGHVTALDAVTGTPAWTRSMAGSLTFSFSTVVTAYRGVVYTSAGGDGGTIFAYDEATGALLFQYVDLSGGEDSPPALTDVGLIVAYPCQLTTELDRLTGSRLWRYTTGCSWGGADIPVLANGRAYITDSLGGIALDVATGKSLSTFTASVPPAIDGTLAFFVNQTQLTAVDTTSGLTAWTFAENVGNALVETPLVAAGFLYAPDQQGDLIAFDETTGMPAWSAPGATPTANMAASGGLLVVPEAMQLVAYGSAGDGGASRGPPGGDGGCAFNMADVQEPVVGSGPASVTMGDLNGDGKPDVVVANSTTSPSTVSVLLGIGNGQFLPAVAYATGAASDAVAIADLNGDGKLDLAVLNGGGGIPAQGLPSSVSVLLGNGDGTFQPQAAYASNTGSAGLAVADLNGDGKLDFAVANNALGNLSILLGNGDGTFQSAITTFDPNRRIAVSIAAGDLNGDGKPDLVVSDENYDVEVLINTGDGTFQAAAPYAVFANPCCVTEPLGVALADVNGDGKLDVAAANFGASNVSVLLGNGDGTLQPQIPLSTNRSPENVRFGDVNGDGKLDLVVSDSQSPDLSVLLGNGDGTFQSQLFFAVHGNTSAMAVGDVNGDGKADIVATSSPNSVGVLLSTCGH